MKKILVAALGLSGLLAGCGTSGGPAAITDPVRNFRLLAYQSEYTLPSDYVDTATNTTYPKGTSIICDNLTTRLSVTVDWDGTIDMMGALLTGRDTTATRTVYSNPLGNVYSARPSVFEFTVGPNTAPLSVGLPNLRAQSITVTPVNTFKVKGATFVSVQASSADGTTTPVRSSVQAIPVADCTV